MTTTMTTMTMTSRFIGTLMAILGLMRMCTEEVH